MMDDSHEGRPCNPKLLLNIATRLFEASNGNDFVYMAEKEFYRRMFRIKNDWLTCDKMMLSFGKPAARVKKTLLI